MHSPSLLLTAALEYAERGWRVIPLHTPTGCAEQPCSCLDPQCESPGKHPRIREWQRQGTTDEAQIRRWWQMWPSSNIGIVCGAGTGWFALDVDGEEGEETLRLLEGANSELPAAPEQMTGSGGRHLLFAYEPGLTNAVKFAPGLDIRTDGGQIVVEPSLHPNGQEYRWELAHHPAELQPPRAPGWLLTAIRKAALKTGGQAPPIGEQIREGHRNSALASVAGGMRRQGADPAEIEAALSVMNRNRCRPPLAEGEVQKIAASMGRYAPAVPVNGCGCVEEEGPFEGDGWEEPIPLYSVTLPEFPVDALPGYLKAMVEATAIATQTPPDLAAMVSLAVLATAMQKRAEALIREGWREVLSLWPVTSLAPGNRKTPAYGPMVAPVQEYERLQIERMRSEIAEAKTEYEVMEGSLKRLKDQAIKAKNEFDRDEFTRQAVAVAQKLEQMPVPKSLRMIADDATPEELGRLLMSNAGRMAIISDEGDVFDMMAGKYSSGKANIGIYLRGHSGGDVLVDRVGRPDVIVRRAAITFGLCVQPESLLGLTSNNTFKGRGLIARFLFSVPYSRLGDRKIRPAPIPPSVSATYAERITYLLDMPADEDEFGLPVPHLVPFSPEADDAVAEFEEWIEPQLRPAADLGYMGDWAGKLVGQTCRIATLLHMAYFAGTPEPWRQYVDASTFQQARQIAEYLIPHAKAAFRDMGSDPAINQAHLVLAWLKKRGNAVFQKREVFNAMRSQFQRADEVDPPLIVLMEHGFIRQLPPEKRPGPGQPPSPSFRVHPVALR